LTTVWLMRSMVNALRAKPWSQLVLRDGQSVVSLSGNTEIRKIDTAAISPPAEPPEPEDDEAESVEYR